MLGEGEAAETKFNLRLTMY